MTCNQCCFTVLYKIQRRCLKGAFCQTASRWRLLWPALDLYLQELGSWCRLLAVCLLYCVDRGEMCSLIPDCVHVGPIRHEKATNIHVGGTVQPVCIQLLHHFILIRPHRGIRTHLLWIKRIKLTHWRRSSRICDLFASHSLIIIIASHSN